MSDSERVPDPGEVEAAVQACSAWRMRIRDTWKSLGWYVTASEVDAYTAGFFDGHKHDAHRASVAAPASLTSAQEGALRRVLHSFDFIDVVEPDSRTFDEDDVEVLRAMLHGGGDE